MTFWLIYAAGRGPLLGLNAAATRRRPSMPMRTAGVMPTRGGAYCTGCGLRLVGGSRGHDVVLVEDWSDLVGYARVIRLDADGLTGGSDPPADGAALDW